MMSDELSSHVARMVVAEGFTLDAVSFSGGEPLLHPLLTTFVERFRPLALERTVITNGLMLSPQKLDTLLAAGVTKFRIGADSLDSAKSRPSPNYPRSADIRAVLGLLIERTVPFELNVVLTEFNRWEIPSIVGYCSQHRISAKFFEHVAVNAHGGAAAFRASHAAPCITEDEFWAACQTVLPGVKTHLCGETGAANTVADCEGYSLRYCRYLCDYGLCYRTGTRIDARGQIFTCMSEKGPGVIRAGEPLSVSTATARRALQTKCVRTRGLRSLVCA